MFEPKLLRKICLENWPMNGETSSYLEVHGDAFSKCLKSESNRISFWIINSEIEAIDAVIAIYLSRDEKVCDITEVILIPEEQISHDVLPLEATEGTSRYQAFNGNHRDITNICYKTLGVLAKVITELLHDSSNYLQVTKDEVLDRITLLVKDHVIDKDTIKRKIVDQLRDRGI